MNIDKIDLSNSDNMLIETLNIHTLSPQYPEWTEDRGEAAFQLISSLLERNGIPDTRKAYFGDPEYNTGRGNGSHYQTFINNGHTDETMMKHPHFLKFVRYFIFGARLPLQLKNNFLQKVEECGTFTSGDDETLLSSARRFFKQSNLNKTEYREEIYKLLLDCGLSLSTARHIRKYL